MTDLTPLQSFTKRIQSLLAQQIPESPSAYLDLSYLKEVDRGKLKTTSAELPPPDPLAEVFRLLLAAVQQNCIDELRLGVNEILKCLLLKVSKDEQHVVQPYLERIHLVFLRSLQGDFAFKDSFWDYICSCLLPVGKVLLSENMNEATRCFLDFMADTGKLAAHNDLHTDRVQQVLRVLEVLAEELQNQEMAIKARDYRQTLEN